MKSKLIIYLVMLFFNCNLFSQIKIEPIVVARITLLLEKYRLEVAKRDNTFIISNINYDTLRSTYQWLIEHAMSTLSYDKNTYSYPKLVILRSTELKVYTAPKVYYSDSECILASHKFNKLKNLNEMNTQDVIQYTNNIHSNFDMLKHPLYSKHLIYNFGKSIDEKQTVKENFIDSIQTQINFIVNNFYFTNDFTIPYNYQIFRFIDSVETSLFGGPSLGCNCIFNKYLMNFVYNPYKNNDDNRLISEVDFPKIVFQEDFKYALVYYQFYQDSGFLVYDLDNKKLLFDCKVVAMCTNFIIDWGKK